MLMSSVTTPISIVGQQATIKPIKVNIALHIILRTLNEFYSHLYQEYNNKEKVVCRIVGRSGFYIDTPLPFTRFTTCSRSKSTNSECNMPLISLIFSPFDLASEISFFLCEITFYMR